MLSNYGVEGVYYTLDENGQPQWTDLVLHNPDGMNINYAIHYYALHHGPMNRVWNRDAAGYTDDENACEGIWGISDDAYVMPAITMTADEGTEFANIMTDADAYVNEMAVKFVNGMADLNDFDAFTAQLKAMRVEDAIAIQQAALTRLKNNHPAGSPRKRASGAERTLPRKSPGRLHAADFSRKRPARNRGKAPVARAEQRRRNYDPARASADGKAILV